jgi:hypothetical protein
VDKELKAKWLSALRSGEYKQGRQRLRTHDGAMCCLGVLCEISGIGKWGGGTDAPIFIYKADEGFDADTDLDLSYRLRNRFGMEVGIHNKLVSMNDTERATFEQIADYIEKEMPCS